MIDEQSRHPLCWGARQAQAEGLTLRKSDNMSGYANVSMPQRTNPLKPYQALVTRGGKNGKKKVLLGSFATAEEAALCVARSPEGRAAERAAAAEPKAPLTKEQALQQAQAEGLALRKADNASGYANVSVLDRPLKSYLAQVRGGSGQQVTLGSYFTAEEAALCVARSPEGQAMAARVEAAAALPSTQLTREQALQQAQAERLVLRKADNKSGYWNVSSSGSSYQARVSRSGKKFTLGSFDTAEEAALCVARSPEGQAAAAEWAAGTPPTTSNEEEEGIVPPMPADAVVKEEAVVPAMPSNARWSDSTVKEENTVVDTAPPMPADAIVKQAFLSSSSLPPPLPSSSSLLHMMTQVAQREPRQRQQTDFFTAGAAPPPSLLHAAARRAQAEIAVDVEERPQMKRKDW